MEGLTLPSRHSENGAAGEHVSWLLMVTNNFSSIQVIGHLPESTFLFVSFDSGIATCNATVAHVFRSEKSNTGSQGSQQEQNGSMKKYFNSLSTLQ